MSAWPSARWQSNVPDARIIPDEPPTLRLVEAAPEPPPERAPEDWLHEVRTRYIARTKDWITQSWALLVSPRRTMDEWATGRRELLRPTRFFAFGTAISYVVEKGSRWLMHLPKPVEVWWMSLLHASWALLVITCVVGAGAHLLLRKRGRLPLHATMAAVMYAGAGPGVLLTVAGWLVSLATYWALGRDLAMHVQGKVQDGEATSYVVPWPVQLVAQLGIFWTFAALAGAQRVRWWWPVLSYLALLSGVVAFAFGITGVSWVVKHCIHAP